MLLFYKLTINIDADIMKTPLFKIIINSTGNYAYRCKDGMLSVSIGSLKTRDYFSLITKIFYFPIIFQ